MFQRSHIHLLEGRLKEERKFIQVITGPRQVGKTTLVGQLLEELAVPSHFVSADAIDAFNSVWIRQQWEIARIKMKTSEIEEYVLAIDEVQKIDNWSEFVKAEWDKDTKEGRNIKVLLLGSSRLLLQQGLTESLAGRFESIYMGHWSFIEMQEAFDFDEKQFVWHGGYPGAAALIEDEKRWKDYVKAALIETTISRDILVMTRVDKPALLKQLFELGCLYSGQILSYSKMVGQLQDAGNTTTLSHYLNLLSTAGLLGGIEKYYIEKVRQRASSPKLQVYNTALISAQMSETFEEVSLRPERWGRWVESAVGAHIINCSHMDGLAVHYWRHRSDEIDFVLTYRSQVLGIEVKSGVTQKSSGMSAFQKKFNPDKVLIVGDTGLPWQEFLKIKPTDLF